MSVDSRAGHPCLDGRAQHQAVVGALNRDKAGIVRLPEDQKRVHDVQ